MEKYFEQKKKIHADNPQQPQPKPKPDSQFRPSVSSCLAPSPEKQLSVNELEIEGAIRAPWWGFQ
eukprot:443105-Amorphochlora_amoeboformis.AAC.1